VKNKDNASMLEFRLEETNSKDRLDDAINYARKFLPHQGPLEYFVHHNTLHAFEKYHFFDALSYANSLYQARTQKSLSWYQHKYKDKRICDADLSEIIERIFPDQDDFVKNIIFWNPTYVSPPMKECKFLMHLSFLFFRYLHPLLYLGRKNP